MKLIKKFAACFIAVSLVFGGISVHASNPSARNISIFRVDGDNVSLSRGDARSATPRDGQRLNEGNVLTTGLNSSVHIQMDTDSILQMSASSQVAVGQSGNNLVLSVQSGSALVDVRDQSPGNTTETRIGNVGLTVRGTMYTMGIISDFVSVVMLSGYGEVEGEPLHAGQIMHVFDEHRPGADVLYYETGYFRLMVLDIYSLGELELFTLEVMYEHSVYLLEAGTLTPEMLEILPYLIHERRVEAEARLAELMFDLPTVIVPMPDVEEEEAEEPERRPRPPREPDDGGHTPFVPPLPARPPLVGEPGHVDTPHVITNSAQFMRLLINYTCPNGWLGHHFSLDGSISLGALPSVIGAEAIPGTSNPVVFEVTPFRGHFHGNGHTINFTAGGLQGSPYAGLFARIGAGGFVENLIISTAHIIGGNIVGTFAGAVDNGGVLRNVRLIGSVSISATATSFGVGGIVGVVRSGGIVEDVHVAGTLNITPGAATRGNIAGVVQSGGRVNVWSVDAGVNSNIPLDVGRVDPGGQFSEDPFVSFGFTFLMTMLEEYEDEYPENYPAKEDDNDDDYPAKNEEEEDDDYPAKEEEDDEEPGDDDDDEDKYLEEEDDEDDADDTKQEEYAPTFPEDDFELREYVLTFPEDDFELKGYYA